MRAGAIGPYRGGPPAAAIRDDRSARGGGALRDTPAQITDGSSLPRTLRNRIDDPGQGSHLPRSVVVCGHIDTLLERLHLDTSAEQVLWLLTESDDRPERAGAALEELMKGQTILGGRMKELERASRFQLESETARLIRELDGADHTAERIIQEAADKVYQALPMILLLPNGVLEKNLRQCLEELDAAGASDNGHREIDHLMQRQMRALESGLKQQDRETYHSWAAVGEYLASYDEQRPTLTVVGSSG
jgi:hypothetical protein